MLIPSNKRDMWDDQDLDRDLYPNSVGENAANKNLDRDTLNVDEAMANKNIDDDLSIKEDP